jgi:hypothetical protein
MRLTLLITGFKTTNQSPVTRPDISNLLNSWPEAFMPVEFDDDTNQLVSEGSNLDVEAEPVLSSIPQPKDGWEDISDDENPDDGGAESGWSSADFLASDLDNDKSDYDKDSSGEERRKAIQATAQTQMKGGEGMSKSAVWGREVWKKLWDGTFVIDPIKQVKY